MGVQGRQVLVGMTKRGEGVVTAAPGDDGAKNFGNREGRRHGVEE
jgi:hypothetical protein